MKTTVDLYLDIRRQNKYGKYYVKVRITHMKKQKYYATEVSLSKDEFKQVMSKPKGDLKEQRIKLDSELERARSHIKDLPAFSFNNFENSYHQIKKSAYDIFPFFDDVIKTKRATGKIKTAIGYQTTINSLKAFQSKIGFYDINKDFLDRYHQWMIIRENSNTTIGIYLRNLRAIYNLAYTQGVIKDLSLFPFKKGGYRIPQSRNIKKALTKKEILSIHTFLDFHSKEEEVARDFWMFSYLANGINMNDVFRLRWSDMDIDCISFIRKKTSDTVSNNLPIIIPLLPELKNIIKKYGNKSNPFIFDVLNENMNEEAIINAVALRVKTINKYMKRIAGRIGIEGKCTTYTARHSFAQSLKDGNTDLSVISEALGHQSQSTTRSYLNSFKIDVMKKAARNLLK